MEHFFETAKHRDKHVTIITVMEKSNLEIRVEHIEKVVGDIQRDVKGLATRVVGMDARMARVEALMEGVHQRVVNAEQKVEKTENRLWVTVIAVIAAGGIPALVSRFLS